MATIGTNIEAAANFLNQGKVIGIPTETVYGLAGNAFDLKAITSIFEVKNRPFFDPLIVHVHSIDQIKELTTQIPEEFLQLMTVFSPGPITYLLNKTDKIPDLVTSGLERAAIRIPKHAILLDLLKAIDFPLVAPSANPFGYISPTTAFHVNTQLGSKIPYVLDGGPCSVGLESTIVGFQNNQLTVYRKGGLAIEELKPYFNDIVINEHSSSSPKTPGMLAAHYAPKCPLKIFNDGMITEIKDRSVFLGFNRPNKHFKNNIILSKTGEMAEAAKNLFAVLRDLDSHNYNCIYVELLEEKGLGRAINDRLRRAAASS